MTLSPYNADQFLASACFTKLASLDELATTFGFPTDSSKGKSDGTTATQKLR